MTMHTRWIATGALILSLLCSCRSSGGPEYQASKRESPTQAKDASEQIKEISTSQLKDWMTTGQTLTLIDVREDNEWQAGHAATAMHISRWTLSGKIGTVVPDKTARIVLYCLGGVRSAAAAETLQKMGYTNVYSLTGGFKNYQLAGLPIRK
jgi:rhodanese-related sulfurtransferase